LFEMKAMHVVVDTQDGPSLGRTVTDWWGATDEPTNTLVATRGDADQFFTLITERLARL